jgi:hypothetical protein
MPFVGDSDVAVKQVGDNDWELLKKLVYQGNYEKFTVPAGTGTDFASVPRPFVWFIPRYGKYTRAAILHDYLWRVKALSGEISWADADGLFRRTLRELDVAFLRRWIMWSAVRLASMAKKQAKKGRFAQIPRALLCALVAILIVGPPALVIVASLAVFWVVEWIAFGLLKVGTYFKSQFTKAPPPVEVNAPSIRMKL